MRTRPAVLLLCLALAIPTAAGAAPGPKATGGGKAGSAALFGFAFTAQGTPTDAKGMVNYRRDAQGTVPALYYKGEVTCYTQTGATAAFSGVIEQAEGTTAGFFIWNVIDRGEGASTVAPGDALRQRVGTSPFDCTDPNTAFPGVVTDGNIQVHPAE